MFGNTAVVFRMNRALGRNWASIVRNRQRCITRAWANWIKLFSLLKDILFVLFKDDNAVGENYTLTIIILVFFCYFICHEDKNVTLTKDKEHTHIVRAMLTKLICSFPLYFYPFRLRRKGFPFFIPGI